MEEIKSPISVGKNSLLSRITGIFYEPTSVFKSLDEKPDLIGAILIPVIAFLITSVTGVLLTFRNPEFLDKLTKMPEQAATITKYGGPVIGGLFGVIGGLILFFIYAGIIHVIAPFLDGKSSFKKLIAVLGYSNAPIILFGLLMLLFALLNTSSYTPFTASLGLVLTKEKVGLTMNALYSHIDLFAFWSLFLSIIGMAIIYKFSWKKAATIVLTLWLIGLGIQVGITKVMEPFIKQSEQSQDKPAGDN
jgi:hypothetical protein